jgi:hypothetical protein
VLLKLTLRRRRRRGAMDPVDPVDPSRRRGPMDLIVSNRHCMALPTYQGNNSISFDGFLAMLFKTLGPRAPTHRSRTTSSRYPEKFGHSRGTNPVSL